MALLPTTEVFDKDGNRAVVNTCDLADWRKRGFEPKAEHPKAKGKEASSGK